MSKKTTMVLVVSSNIIGNALKLQKIEKLHWQIGNEVINDNQKKNKEQNIIHLPIEIEKLTNTLPGSDVTKIIR